VSTIALLDTGVDLAHPYPARRILAGIDLINGGRRRDCPLEILRIRRSSSITAPSSQGCSSARAAPAACTASRPGGNGASRFAFAGWQPAADGPATSSTAAATRLIAGLDRAVRPNGDGDAHDAVRVALIGVSEPYAAFAPGDLKRSRCKVRSI